MCVCVCVSTVCVCCVCVPLCVCVLKLPQLNERNIYKQNCGLHLLSAYVNQVSGTPPPPHPLCTYFDAVAPPSVGNYYVLYKVFKLVSVFWLRVLQKNKKKTDRGRHKEKDVNENG